MTFYEKISDYLKQNGIKQTFIADKCGWTKQKLLSQRRPKTPIHHEVGIPGDEMYSSD